MTSLFRPQFWLDVEEGVAYLAEKTATEVAVRWHNEVFNSVARIERWPDLGRMRTDLEPAGIRSFILSRFPRYLIFYRASSDTIEFLRVKHGMMDLPKLF